MAKTIYQLSFEHNGHGGLRDQIVNVVEKTSASLVRFQAYVPEDRRSSKVLGSIRQGTGVFINPQGYILTVGYLILEATEIQVVLADEQVCHAQVIGIDVETGLGIIRLTDPISTEPITFGSSTRVLSEQLTVTIGDSIEAQARIVTNGRVFNIGQFVGYWEYILDRAIYVTPQNPAFGGSPLFNIEGEVIGIISLQLNQHQGMNLAIPVEMFYNIKSELIQYGRVLSRSPRPWIGVYHAPYQHTIVIVEVVPDGPADKAGLEKGDIIISIGGHKVAGEETFLRQLWNLPIHTEFPITFWRRNAQKTVSLRGIDFYEFYNMANPSNFLGQ